ncbi:MAG TPA: hypothetical protein VFD31_06280 [Thermoleophilaceae bacterium]|nr:hypothetical protein [Thermoleophilaceae bacterium]
MAGLFERGVLLSPALVRRAATGRARTPEERWILGQSKAVRESFVREVLDPPGDPVVLQQIWMMRQPDAVRESYVGEVLEPTLG